MCQAVQSRCTNDADIRSNHKCEQYDAYPQDHTSYLTAANGNHWSINFTTNFLSVTNTEVSLLILLHMGNI